MSRFFVSLGLIFLLLGLILFVLEKFHLHLFRLPGDIVIRKGNFTLFIPITTSIVLSLLLTLLMNVIRK